MAPTPTKQRRRTAASTSRKRSLLEAIAVTTDSTKDGCRRQQPSPWERPTRRRSAETRRPTRRIQQPTPAQRPTRRGAARRTRRDRSGGSRRAKDDEKTAAARNGTETRRDQLVTPRRRLRRQTTTQQRGVVDGEFFAERCPLAPTAHTGPAAVPGGSLPSRQSTRTRWITAFRTGTLPPLSTSENSAQTRAKTTSNTLEVTPRSVQLNKYHVEL